MAVGELMRKNVGRDGRSLDGDVDRLERLAKLGAATDPPVQFRRQVRTVLIGLAVRRGEDPIEVLALFRGPPSETFLPAMLHP